MTLEEEIKKQFMGAWKLIHCIEKKADGTIFHTWGEKANGYIIYTLEGIMSVQIMRAERKKFGTMNIQKVTELEAFALAHDYNAYFGIYEVDIKNHAIIHHVEGHLDPNFIGKPNIRRYDFSENRLSLTTINEEVYRELLWEKV